MYCPKCGTENPNDAGFCSKCGGRFSNSNASTTSDESVGALGIVFFCIPLIGAIMYFVWKGDHPEKSQQACNLALWGVGFGIVLNILAAILGGM